MMYSANVRLNILPDEVFEGLRCSVSNVIYFCPLIRSLDQSKNPELPIVYRWLIFTFIARLVMDWCVRPHGLINLKSNCLEI